VRRAALVIAALAAACNANVAFDPEGYQCDEGNSCPTGYVCAARVCRSQAACPNGACACEGVVCPAAPATQCLDATTQRAFAAGVCNSSDGACRFAPVDSVCAQGCVNGACVASTCPATPCADVPVTACASGTMLRVYSGVCAVGACSYPSNDIACYNGCVDGHCVNQDLCAGVTCSSAPAAACVAGALRTFDATGVCNPANGQCAYTPHDTTCPLGCLGGACVGPALVFSQTGPRIHHAVNAVDQAPSSFGSLLLAVGPGGAATRWNGSNWTGLVTPTTEVLNAVWLSSSTSGWVVGDNKTLLRYDGTGLSAVALSGGPAGAKLVAVHGHTDNHVVVADGSGNYWRYNGTTWTTGSLPAANGPYTTTSVYVDDLDHERLAGTCGTTPKGFVAYASTLATPTFWVDVDTAGAEGVRALGPSVEPTASDYAYAGGDTTASVRRHYTFTSPYFDVTRVPTGLAGGPVLAISASAAATGQAVYLLTGRSGAFGGQLYRFTSALALDPTSALLEFWGTRQAMSRTDSGGVIVADSFTSSATVFRRGTVTNQVMDLGEDWQAAGFAGGSLLLMNSYGDVATRLAGGTYSLKRSPATRMTALAAGLSYSLLVGPSGAAYRYGASYTSLTSNTPSALNAVCRVSDVEWYLVGDSGVLRGSDGFSVSSFTSPTTQNLADVACLGVGHAVAVGASGTVLRRAGGAWQAVSPPFPESAQLTSVGQGLSGALYVAGDNLFYKLEGGVWTKLPGLPGLRGLQVRGPSDIYAISNGTKVVRFDGSAWSTSLTLADTLAASAASAGKVVFAGRSGALVEGQ
jgi:hypothetical protein